ncbi:glutaredoxin-like protein DUF836 [Melghiribacillus thermohalophilus]|uniref:Glutaredoxin-like protein DUF836 n=1 Tax=Melghiribacillus thermohalophilus TaxID=1324956 RepID=A0A4R3MTJ0_9BACI|nr:glutaredoxin family protein [Melghiribacillus thermohalophilus]TCT18786.1 glutaredoxin-like protein DUF836 [Melghiribacillus thermohalophilus]
MQELHFYMRNNCPLCEEAKTLLELFHDDWSFRIIEHDIEQDDHLLERYHIKIPVIAIHEEELDASEINYESLEKFLKKHCGS